MRRLALQFAESGRVVVEEEHLSGPAPDQVLVRTLVSAISAGTEMLVYRGQWPEGIPVDPQIPSLHGEFQYPLKYGYATVGRVEEIGSNVSKDWLDKTVFALNPHESHFLADPDRLTPLPSLETPEQAAFLPNMETAVNLVMDGGPLIGEKVVVFGQGVVGLLVTSVLSRFPLAHLITVDKHEKRRESSIHMGANISLDPDEPTFAERLYDILHDDSLADGADLLFEVSGDPGTLNEALSCAGFDGRIVIGSWYGTKRADLDLGGRFHRERIRLIGSQVSSIAPGLRGRWNAERRLKVALRMIGEVHPERLITHRFSITEAADAYRLLDRDPDQAIQVILTYETTHRQDPS
jgi:2-desacetyl-2-hydroxyethyl bacteriochlorophyllide A dehydrogenase